jgi:hypothetical protein
MTTKYTDEQISAELERAHKPRQLKYTTDEERKAARAITIQKYYETHREQRLLYDAAYKRMRRAKLKKEKIDQSIPSQ